MKIYTFKKKGINQRQWEEVKRFGRKPTDKELKAIAERHGMGEYKCYTSGGGKGKPPVITSHFFVEGDEEIESENRGQYMDHENSAFSALIAAKNETLAVQLEILGEKLDRNYLLLQEIRDAESDEGDNSEDRGGFGDILQALPMLMGQGAGLPADIGKAFASDEEGDAWPTMQDEGQS